jgi:hypothetical protein
MRYTRRLVELRTYLHQLSAVTVSRCTWCAPRLGQCVYLGENVVREKEYRSAILYA